ncbi:MAG: M1 family aminopeptidase, partial [Bacteroidota bacterium]
ELAHQWWGHQVTPNYTRGSNLISESLAEYTALVLAERKYGRDNMQRLLRQELDSYLSGRSRENKKENTFINCNRAYQWYYKGSLILYGLRDFIGDAQMNKAIRAFREEFALKEEPPYAGSNDLYRHFQKVVPDSLKYYLEDTWTKLTLYENKLEEAKVVKTKDNKYEVTLKLNTQKLYADSLGMETKAKYPGDYIEVGIFAPETTNEQGRKVTNPIYIKKHKLAPGQHTLKILVDKEPKKAGIDPYNKLIDRRPDDNILNVDLES